MATLALGCAAAAALVLPTAGSAHATLISAVPATQSRVDEPPMVVVLRFSEPLTITSDAVRVLAANGAELDTRSKLSDDGRVVSTRVVGLDQGRSYTVRWRVTGVDGHSPAGVFTFGVGVRAPPPTEATGSQGTTWLDDLARWALFAALALLIGPLVIRLWVLPRAELQRRVPPALERRIHVLTTLAAFLVIDIGIIAFVLRASNALQVPFGDLLYGDLEPFAEKTRFGVAFLVMTVGFGLVAALLLVAWIFDRLELRWPALVLSVALVSSLSVSGHQATEPNSSLLAQLADWLHLVAACVWVGGLVALALCVWPLAPTLRRQAFLGFARLAIVLVAVMVLAGAYLALVRLPELSDLWQTGYGRLLLLKMAIVVLALAWGGMHHFVVRPRLEAGGAPRVRASLVGEALVALVVLLVAAALTNGSPPPVESPAPAATRSAR
jgi:copper transport protein